MRLKFQPNVTQKVTTLYQPSNLIWMYLGTGNILTHSTLEMATIYRAKTGFTTSIFSTHFENF
jgi:hypothetical protein